jgi:hypothetical protein
MPDYWIGIPLEPANAGALTTIANNPAKAVVMRAALFPTFLMMVIPVQWSWLLRSME